MRNIVRIIYPTLTETLYRPPERHRDIFHRAICCVRALVNFSLVAQYRAHTEETIGYLEEYLEDFHKYKDVFKPFRTTKATRKAADRHVAKLKLALHGQHILEDEEGPALTEADKRQRDRADKEEIVGARREFISKKTNFSFVKIHLLSHYIQGIRSSGELIQQSAEYPELMHGIQLKRPYNRTNKGEEFERQIFNDYSRLHCFRIRRLTLLQMCKEGHCTPDIQRVLGLYNPKDKNKVARCLREARPIPPDLPVYFPKDEPEPTARRLRAPTHRNSFVRQQTLPAHNHRLSEYILRFYEHEEGRQDLTTEVVNTWQAQEHRLLDVPVAKFQSYDNKDSDVHTIRCTGEQTFRGKVRNDHVWVNRATAGGTRSDLGSLLPAKVIKLYNLRDDQGNKKVALIKLFHPEANGTVDSRTGLI